MGDEFDNCDVWICPSWQTSSIPNSTFDLSINIESMQEMDQHHVDFYLNGFNSWSKDDGVIYLSNSKDYVFKGEWKIPKQWDLVLTERGPRAWTKNHPTECYITKRREEDCLIPEDLEIMREVNLRLAKHKQSLTVTIETLTLELKESKEAYEIARQELKESREACEIARQTPLPARNESVFRKVVKSILRL